ncbi:TIGR01212 family radical SAM protein [Helicobacter monodelphidis]|uniref:TIGR01212 family radical SAM protein n=1 Tax=Helicobacter sp. 15-1451 TaxID=2004995 RepID=UPI0015EC9023|nr:TIGR01212 family radical SAM protein [Helicobacter sp. 15-1451]
MLTFGRYFQRRFGERVRKVPLSIPGFTCPNIDGTLARGGCIFCKNESFSPSLNSQEVPKLPFKLKPSMQENPILQQQIQALNIQFETQSEYHRKKFKMRKFLAYFQSFTNTYAPLETLKILYNEALKRKEVVGISIGTRFDSITLDILDYLAEWVQKDKEVWVEYGVQSIHQRTLELINRGHDCSALEYWVDEARKRGIKICIHLIYGLPEETDEMILASLEEVLRIGLDGLKIHPLYVMEHTKLAQMYKAGEYMPISLEHYGDLLVKSLKLIPADVVMHRISAGVHSGDLLAPKWCMDKNIQMNYLRQLLRSHGIEY